MAYTGLVPLDGPFLPMPCEALLRPGQVIQIVGKRMTGRTTLALKLLAQLPSDTQIHHFSRRSKNVAASLAGLALALRSSTELSPPAPVAVLLDDMTNDRCVIDSLQGVLTSPYSVTVVMVTGTLVTVPPRIRDFVDRIIQLQHGFQRVLADPAVM